ncbi:hypothetical protein [Xanthomonas phaseoli]|uniref:hypothetical protein n=1 Tax=Xanthomonas phaseoli TaxID=1985254 RepID=UPI00123758AF|nr:hypothetical protein [Xanthomonas phaseoli]
MRLLTKEEEVCVSGGRSYRTAGGNTVNVAANLSDAQIATVGQIVDYGYSHRMLKSEVTTAVNQAFYESSLGTITSNPTNPNVQGLYQYDASTWDYLGHSSLNRSSTDDQIAAMFDDIRSFESRWASGRQNGSIPKTLLLEDYIEIKHHLGPNSTNWSSPVLQDYHGKVTVLGFSSVSAGSTGSGGEAGGSSGGGITVGGSSGGSPSTGTGSVTVGPPKNIP